MNTLINNFDNVKNLICTLFLPFLVILFLTKINLVLVNYYYRKNLINCGFKNNKRTTLVIIQTVLLLFLQNGSLLPLKFLSASFSNFENNFFLLNLIPIASVASLVQFILMISFLIDDNNKIHKLYFFRTILLIYLLLATFSQFLLTTWNVRDILFSNFQIFITLIISYLLLSFFVFKLFNSNLIIIRSLVNVTLKILKQKKNDKVNLGYEKIFANSTKRELIMQAWDFSNKKISKLLEKVNNIKQLTKKIKTAIIMFFISENNFLNRNTLKYQTIFINGWKSVVKK